ncbi:MAG: ester cyclase [Chlamydiales bacterium]|nr:ester cyclase [Chlamydiales bacterium]
MKSHSSNEKDAPKLVAETYAHQIWDEKNLTAIDELIHQNCVIHSLLGDFYGPGSMKNVVQTWLNAFPDLVVKNRSLICDKDLVAIQWQAQGSHQGEFKGIRPTGRSISYAGATVYRVSQNQIVEYWAYLDMKHLLDQIS